MISIGIDPDARGAIVALDHHRDVVAAHRMPLVGRDPDEGGIWDILRSIVAEQPADAPMVAVLERLTPMPATLGGAKANYRRGQYRGIFRAIVIGLAVPLEEPTPHMWQTVALQGIMGGGTKEKARKRIAQGVPGLDVLPGRCRRPHQGLCDAGCLAEYGLLRRGT